MIEVVVAVGAAMVVNLWFWLRFCAQRLERFGASPTVQNLFLMQEIEEEFWRSRLTVPEGEKGEELQAS
ncbi:MAG: hypothetical protein AAFU77_13245 [Myxococcota bacterium]